MANCSSCGSSNVQFRRENVGEVRGKGAKQVVHRTVGYCKDCGNTWVVSNDEIAVPKKKRTLLWVLGWLFIFPLPLTILLLRKKEMNKVVKYIILAVAWIFYILIMIGANANNKTAETAQEPTTVVEQTVDKTIDVTFDVKPNVNSDNGKVLFSIATNLPEDTQLLVTVSNDEGFSAQDKAVVLANGVANTAEFSNQGEALKGAYKVTVSMSLPSIQKESVQEVVGKNGEYLTGQYVQKTDTGINWIEAEFDFEF